MSSSVVVVDYGIGNVFSVCNALRKVGAEPVLTRELPAIRAAERVVLPGVGAFARAMDALRGFGLDDALRNYVETGRPFLGVCIGMQVLMDVSDEFGEHAGLGFISGRVQRIQDKDTGGRQLRVPHICWAPVHPTAEATGRTWQSSVMRGEEGREFYFVHSYHAVPVDPTQRLAVADYGGNEITAAIRKDNVTGVQFHPERSGPEGLQLLRNFATGQVD